MSDRLPELLDAKALQAELGVTRGRLRPLEHGYRSDGWHLMIDKRGGRGAVFLVRAGRVERWPQMLIGCA